jgi:hypothetical protein
MAESGSIQGRGSIRSDDDHFRRVFFGTLEDFHKGGTASNLQLYQFRCGDPIAYTKLF